jgi:dTDP-4-amino-4,6-dideoxygalactose transaminase
METSPKIPLLIPKLPTFDKIVPYLKKIDENHWYTNWGPLTRELESKLAAHFKVAADHLVVVVNGTEALVLGLLSLERPKTARYCLLPSWTFAATPLAAVHAGLIPVFVDIGESQWMITPRIVKEAMAQLKIQKKQIHSVMAVSPFGSPVDMGEWAQFQEETGVPVLIDAAASFDAFSKSDIFYPSTIPVMLSLHATKAFGMGEGAVLFSKDAAFIKRVHLMTNFGFGGARESLVLGKNGKISEYGSAVGLAELEGWPEKRSRWDECTKAYLASREPLEKLGIEFMPGYGEGWISSYCNVIFKSEAQKQKAREGLAARNIDAREWWGRGCHTHPALSAYPKTSLEETSVLSSRVIGLPFYVDLTPDQIVHVVEVLGKVLKD